MTIPAGYLNRTVLQGRAAWLATIVAVVVLMILSAGVVAAQQPAWPDRCKASDWNCRKASIKRNEARTHPLLRETLPDLVEALQLDTSRRYRNIDLISPEFASALDGLLAKYPQVMPLLDLNDAEREVSSITAECEASKETNEQNACLINDLRSRLLERCKIVGCARAGM